MTVFIAWSLVLWYTVTLIFILVVLGIMYRYFLREERELEELRNTIRELDNNMS